MRVVRCHYVSLSLFQPAASVAEELGELDGKKTPVYSTVHVPPPSHSPCPPSLLTCIIYAAGNLASQLTESQEQMQDMQQSIQDYEQQVMVT